MFRDIGDKLGVIRGEIGLAKCLVKMKSMKEAMNYYQLAVKASHSAGNKVQYQKQTCQQRFALKAVRIKNCSFQNGSYQNGAYQQ